MSFSNLPDGAQFALDNLRAGRRAHEISCSVQGRKKETGLREAVPGGKLPDVNSPKHVNSAQFRVHCLWFPIPMSIMSNVNMKPLPHII